MTTTTKLPQPGEYWRTRGGGIAYVAFDKSAIFTDDSYPLQCYIASGGGLELTQSGTDYETMQSSNDLIEYLPDCTGFDWKPKPEPAVDPGEGYELLPVGTVLQDGDEFHCVDTWKTTSQPGDVAGVGGLVGVTYRRKITPAEVWPKWYVTILGSNSYYRCDSETCVWSITADSQEKQSANASILRNAAIWLEVTEAEALARITPPTPLESLSHCQECGEFRGHGHECKPVEDPEELVDITESHPEHIPRSHVDWFLPCDRGAWREQQPEMRCITVGEEFERYGTRHRCKRKDLPKPQPAVKRVPVRLYWYDGNIVGRYAHTPPMDESFTEILSNGNGGWYVEVQQ